MSNKSIPSGLRAMLNKHKANGFDNSFIVLTAPGAPAGVQVMCSGCRPISDGANFTHGKQCRNKYTTPNHYYDQPSDHPVESV